MQLTNLLALALLPLQILALPSAVAPEQRDAAAVEADETINPEGVSLIPGEFEVEERDDHPSKIFARAQNCRVTGTGAVNCRACASTSCRVTHTVRGGTVCEFLTRTTLPREDRFKADKGRQLALHRHRRPRHHRGHHVHDLVQRVRHGLFREPPLPACQLQSRTLLDVMSSLRR